MSRRDDISGYVWNSAALTCAHDYLLPTFLSEMARLKLSAIEGRVFELGCGNGSVANELAQQGWDVTGADPATEGIAQANARGPQLKLFEG